jgi:hypothetical protein
MIILTNSIMLKGLDGREVPTPPAFVDVTDAKRDSVAAAVLQTLSEPKLCQAILAKNGLPFRLLQKSTDKIPGPGPSMYLRGLPPGTTLQDVVTNVTGCVKCLFTLLDIYGYDTATAPRAFEKTVKRWTLGSLASGNWMKFVKWKFASYFHYQSGNLDVAPPVPWKEESGYRDVGAILCCGKAGRFANHLLRSTKIVNDAHLNDVKKMKSSYVKDTFLASILQLKKGCPRPDERMVKESVDSSVIELTTEHKMPAGGPLVDWGDLDEKYAGSSVLDWATVFSHIDRTIDEVYLEGECEYDDTARYRMLFPSTAACKSRPRSRGGAFMECRNFAYKEGFCRLGKRWENPKKEGKTIYESPPPRVELRDRTTGVNDINMVTDVELTDLEITHRNLYERMLQSALQEPSLVKAVGLAESLKVRMITAGAPLTQQVLRPLQKHLHGILRRHPTFSLIGKPVSSEEVSKRFGGKLADNEMYLSGDYKASTDRLHPRVSEYIARALARRCKLRAEEEELFVRNLVVNVFDHNGKHLPQKWGQLMGSIISFPVLCLANAAMCRMSIEIDRQRKVSLREANGLMINGDDVAFKTTMRGHGMWERCTAFAGLESSLGKTFLSRTFVQINSTNFTKLEEPVLVPGDRLDAWKKVWFEMTEYVNLGLLFGLKRSGEKVGKDAIADDHITLGTRCRELISRAPEPFRHRLMRKFIGHHDAVLKDSRVPWFVPESLGGVGLPPLICPGERPFGERHDREYRYYPSVHNLMVAARLLECPKNASGKPKYPVGKVTVEASWIVHREVMKRLEPHIIYGYPTELEERNTSLTYSALCYDVYLSDVRAFKRAKSDKDDDRIKTDSRTRVLRRNARSWAKAAADGQLPRAINVKTLTKAVPVKPYLRANPIGIRQEILDERKPASWRLYEENLEFDPDSGW